MGYARHTSTSSRVPRAAAVKKNLLQMASLVDQSHESELLPASMDKVQEWTERYIPSWVLILRRRKPLMTS